MDDNIKLSQDIIWDAIPQSLKLEEYFNYYDLGEPDFALDVGQSDFLLVIAHKSIEDAINDNIFDPNTEIVPFDKTNFSNGKFSAYIVPHNISDRQINKGDCLILDISCKNYTGEGLYVTFHDNNYYIKFINHSVKNPQNIVAKVCELRRTKF